MITYSFIIPHHNTPDLLNRCLDSIPQRKDIEIIVVDDNSDFDKKPQTNRTDVKFIYIDAEHTKGAGRARNEGVKYAKGRWLLFADADDHYTDRISILLDNFMNVDDIDIVYLNACKFDQNGIVSDVNESRLIKAYMNSMPQAEMRLRYDSWTPWSRMVKRKMVIENNIKFDELPAANDKMFGLLCSKHSKHITVEPEIVYCYFRPSYKSQTDKKRTNLMFDEIMDLQCRTQILYQEVGYNLIPSLLKIAFFSKYSKGVSKKTQLKKYIEVLKKTNTSFIRDLVHFIESEYKKSVLK